MSHSVRQHFTARASHYDRSARWCTDEDMLRTMIDLGRPNPASRMLDAACGTGLVSKAFQGKVGRIVGVDITEAMCSQASPFVDSLVLGSLESLPFSGERFDLTVCRQGVQFCQAEVAIAEFSRVTRPSGRIVVVNLCSYGDYDFDEFSEIQRLRNPARREFFSRERLIDLLVRVGCHDVTCIDYISREDVQLWADNKAISDPTIRAIRDLYLRASPAFSELHKLDFRADGTIIDHMLFCMVAGTR